MSSEITFMFASVVTLVACIWLLIRVHMKEVLLEAARLNELFVTDVALKLLDLQVDCVQMSLQMGCITVALLTSMALVFRV